mmetsp:Transcript_26905/g.58739  ORF Transcript_26905/g.58739 Transcript_26905/m.58739 type:complete len:118 (-) Transcript_26905:709-1062(-)
MASQDNLQETYDALSTILKDPETFNQVVDTVFGNIDVNGNGSLEFKELNVFITAVCGQMGVNDPPNPDQVNHVFKHLDLNSDNNVSRDELAVFLQHLFNEQLKHTEEKLKRHPPASR